MINFKVGIMGAGNIAGTVAETLNKLDAFEPYAIASRDIDKANEFGDKYNISKRYGSYEELVNDPDVELIYIATPHSNHAEYAKLCLNAGKPALVEKSFSYNAETTEEIFKLSEEKNIFVGEAMWIRFMPIYMLMMDYIQKGAIGKVNSISCSLGYDLRRVKRLTDLSLAGGALLDLTVYPINLISMIFGPEAPVFSAACAKLDTGVDAQNSLSFNYKGGLTANAFTTLMYEADNNARIYGDRGYIEVTNINCPKNFKVYQADKHLLADINAPEKQISGYEFEFMSARDAIILGKTESPEMPHSETLRIMRMMDTIRKSWKITFPMEEK